MLQREYKTFEKNPTQWEIDISRIHVDLEEAKKFCEDEIKKNKN